MLSLFRTNQFAANILLVFYVLLLRGTIFFVPQEAAEVSYPGILSNVVYDWVGQQGLLADGIALWLVLIHGFLINVIIAKYRLARNVSLYPGLFYVLLVSAFPDFLRLTPALMANTFLLFVLYELFDCYKKYEATGELFNIGLWLGVAILFYFSGLVFLIMVLIGVNILRSFKWRELLIFIAGLLVPFWLAGTWYFFLGQLDIFWDQAIFNNMGSFVWMKAPGWMGYIQLGLFGFLVLLALLSYNRYTFKTIIRTHKYVDIMYWFMAISAFSILIQQDLAADHLLLLAIPLATFLSMTMLYMNDRTAEAFHFLLVAGILLLQTKPLWMG